MNYEEKSKALVSPAAYPNRMARRGVKAKGGAVAGLRAAHLDNPSVRFLVFIFPIESVRADIGSMKTKRLTIESKTTGRVKTRR